MPLNVIQISQINQVPFVISNSEEVAYPLSPLVSATLFTPTGGVATLKIRATLYIDSADKELPWVEPNPEVIENSSAKELGSFLRKYVSKDAELISDKWKGYTPLKNEFSKLKQIASDEGKNFKELHIHIMNIKGWLRGIHHHCSKEHMQDYLNEYHFRYNRRSNMGTIFDVLMKKMVNFK
jgi:hypothetical protein